MRILLCNVSKMRKVELLYNEIEKFLKKKLQIKKIRYLT